jgi:hypothetical protein
VDSIEGVCKKLILFLMYSYNQLCSALNIVQDELIQHNFWDIKLSKIEVFWDIYSSAYGFQNFYNNKKYGAKGSINIPAFSKSKFQELFGTPYVSLKDILRHEYGHAFAYCNKKLISTIEFKNTFGGKHNNLERFYYDSKFFVSDYASLNTMEDFAETFMYYLEYSGVLPKKFNHPIIANKWKFINQLSKIKL